VSYRNEAKKISEMFIMMMLDDLIDHFGVLVYNGQEWKL